MHSTLISARLSLLLGPILSVSMCGGFIIIITKMLRGETSEKKRPLHLSPPSLEEPGRKKKPGVWSVVRSQIQTVIIAKERRGLVADEEIRCNESIRRVVVEWSSNALQRAPKIR